MLLNLAYGLLLILASPWVVYRMIRHGRYRRGISQKLWGLSSKDLSTLDTLHSGTRWWIHAVSVGEVNLLPEFVARLRQQRPDATIYISSSTDTGFNLAVKLFGDQHVFFCPLDFTWAVSRTLDRLKPDQLILTELELWPNLIRLASLRSIPVKVINGRLSERTAGGYVRFAKLTRSSFERLDWVGCQDEPTAERFVNCGVEPNRLQVTGSIKFDNAPSTRDLPAVDDLVRWSARDSAHRVWIVGSTQAGEEEMAIKIYQRLREEFPPLRLVLVPRHQERFASVADLVEQNGLSAHRRSRDESLADAGWNAGTVIVVDTIGELKHLWGIGHLATVGGSFGDRGGQNMLEPAGYGLAVSFGPNTKNFASIADRLLAAGAAVRVNDQHELEQFVRKYGCDLPAADRLGQAAQKVVEQQRGAIESTVDGILESKSTAHWSQINNQAA